MSLHTLQTQVTLGRKLGLEQIIKESIHSRLVPSVCTMISKVINKEWVVLMSVRTKNGRLASLTRQDFKNKV